VFVYVYTFYFFFIRNSFSPLEIQSALWFLRPFRAFFNFEFPTAAASRSPPPVCWLVRVCVYTCMCVCACVYVYSGNEILDFSASGIPQFPSRLIRKRKETATVCAVVAEQRKGIYAEQADWVVSYMCTYTYIYIHMRACVSPLPPPSPSSV